MKGDDKETKRHSKTHNFVPLRLPIINFITIRQCQSEDLPALPITKEQIESGWRQRKKQEGEIDDNEENDEEDEEEDNEEKEYTKESMTPAHVPHQEQKGSQSQSQEPEQATLQ